MELGFSVMAKVLPRDGSRSSQKVMKDNVFVKGLEHQLFSIEHLLPNVIKIEAFIPHRILPCTILYGSENLVLAIIPLDIGVLLAKHIGILEPIPLNNSQYQDAHVI
jgi:hypothetical protein